VTEDDVRSNYLRLSVVALAIAVAVGAAILVLGSGVTWLHEIAGTLLLALLAGTLVLSWRGRPEDPLAFVRATLALLVLVAMGTAGAALAEGWLPADDGWLPGALLLLLGIVLEEMIRHSRRANRPSASDLTPSTAGPPRMPSAAARTEPGSVARAEVTTSSASERLNGAGNSESPVGQL
jgi:hypothetical protein